MMYIVNTIFFKNNGKNEAERWECAHFNLFAFKSWKLDKNVWLIVLCISYLTEAPWDIAPDIWYTDFISMAESKMPLRYQKQIAC